MGHRKALLFLLLFAFAAAVPLALLLGGVLEEGERAVYDAFCRRLVEREAQSDRIALVLIDNQSLRWGVDFHDNYSRLKEKGVLSAEGGTGTGDPNLYVWPWKRSVYEILIQYLAAAGARAVVFDLVLSTPHPSGDREDDFTLGLATLLQNEEGKCYVVHTLNFHEGPHPEKNRLAPWEQKALQAAAVEVEGIETAPFPFERSDRGPYFDPILPYRDILADALEPLDETPGLLRLGAVSVQPDPDAVIRRARVLLRYGGRTYPSLGLAAALAFLETEDGRNTVRLRVDARGLVVDREAAGRSIRLPLTPSGDLLVHYKDPGLEGYEGRGRYPAYPAYRVLLSALGNRALMAETGLDPAAFTLEPAVFKDRIVFIGATALALYDLKAVPVTENYPGVKVHAAVTENVLSGDPLRRLALPYRALLAALLAIAILACTLVGGRAHFKLLNTLLLVGVYLAAAWFLFTRELLWIDTVVPLTGAAASYLGGTTYNYLTEGRQKKRIIKTFRHIAPPVVVDRLVKNPEILNTRGERVEITVFFSDIKGFTTLSNRPEMRRAPEVLTRHLNAYLTEMSRTIRECGGTLDKYIGDAVVAFFGAPLALENHANAACRAALACQERLEGFNARAESEGLPPLHTRIGLYTGEAMVGFVGSDELRSYTAIGSPVNFGARLEGVNKVYGTWILAGDPTVRRAGEGILFRFLDTIRVPGITEEAEPLQVFHVMAPADRATDRDRALAACYARAREHYEGGRFEKANTLFTECAESFHDPAARAMAERCRRLMAHPPEAWDGVFRIESK